ncbi:hypothetical protein [Haliscomenobacter sp.]|uniref:hypothetical protein n=1 Tax=Haliscomenobacter sp. TaxID=2717303 RepID=UPI0033651E7F
MNQTQIQSLLDKYFAGESSLQEEAQLRQLLQEENLPESFKAYQSWFQFLDQELEVGLDDDFEAKIMREIEQQPGEAKPKIRRLQVSWLLRIAAVFVLVAGGLWWMLRSNSVDKPLVAEAETKVIDWSKYEPKTPEEAYEITRKAFHRVANGLNEGTEIASEGLGKMEEMGKVFN